MGFPSAKTVAATLFLLLVNPSTPCEFITTALPPSATGPCKPYTWANPTSLSSGGPSPTTIITSETPTATPAVPWKSGSVIQEGDINCRYPAETRESVDEQTCARLAERYGISLERFYLLNPILRGDCKNVKPWTGYCVRGCKFLFLSFLYFLFCSIFFFLEKKKQY